MKLLLAWLAMARGREDMGSSLHPPAWKCMVHTDWERCFHFLCHSKELGEQNLDDVGVLLFLKIIFVFLENSRENMGIPFSFQYFILPLPQDCFLVSKYARCGLMLRGNPVTRFMDPNSYTGCTSAVTSQVYVKPSSHFQIFGFVFIRILWGQGALLILNL